MNKPSRPLLVGPLLQSFFSEHLCSHKDASIQTIASYRDTFRLLLSYVQQTAGIEPSALRITDLEVTVILAFLAHLEEQRHTDARWRASPASSDSAVGHSCLSKPGDQTGKSPPHSTRHSHELAPVWSRHHGDRLMVGA